MKNWIFISLICLLGMTVQVQAQGWDAQSLHSINGWNMHGFSKGMFHPLILCKDWASHPCA